jgi:acetyl esterase/lipase
MKHFVVLLFLFAGSLLSGATPVEFSAHGLFLDAKPGDSKVVFRLPGTPGLNYARVSMEFKMRIGKFQPVFNSFVGLTRPGDKGYFGMQIRADKSKTLVDKMNGTQYGEVAAWKEETEYRIHIVYDGVSGILVFDAFEPGGRLFQRLQTPIVFRLIQDAGEGLFLTFGLDRVYDHAYYPPWSWKFSDLSVQLTPADPPFTRQTYTYKTVGGLAIQAEVYRRPDSVTRPAVMWLHGGALIFGHRGNISEDQLRRYLDAGFAVVSVDYRLAPETKLADIVGDLRDAYAWIRRDGPKRLAIDPDRIVVVGHSAGAYLALLAGFQCEPRPRALVSFYGYGDITAEWCRQPSTLHATMKQVPREDAYKEVGTRVITGTPFPHQRFRYYLYLRQHALWTKEVSGYDASDVDSLKSFCPALNVTAQYPPTLLIHGDADTDVPFSQSERMNAELERAGVSHEFVRLPGRPHAFDGKTDDPMVATTLDRVIAFLREQVR